jgi:DNA-binding CsgD family transcriptional regulator
MARSPEARILGMVAELQGVLDADEFGAALVGAVRAEVPCEWISLNAIGPRPADLWVLVEPELAPEDVARFGELVYENPLVQRYAQTRDSRVYRFSDVITLAELRRLRVHREFYGPLGIDYQLAFTLPSRPGHILGVALSRTGRDFGDDERDLLEQARPYFIQAYRNVLAFRDLQRAAGARDGEEVLARLRGEGLTAREAQVVRLIARGSANRAVAAELGLSLRTVDKHLENAYRKLGVRSRTELAALVWGADGLRDST